MKPILPVTCSAKKQIPSLAVFQIAAINLICHVKEPDGMSELLLQQMHKTNKIFCLERTEEINDRIFIILLPECISFYQPHFILRIALYPLTGKSCCAGIQLYTGYAAREIPTYHVGQQAPLTTAHIHEAIVRRKFYAGENFIQRPIAGCRIRRTALNTRRSSLSQRKATDSAITHCIVQPNNPICQSRINNLRLFYCFECFIQQ